MRVIIAMTSAILAACVATGAGAQSPPSSARVSYADLDLASVQGRAALEQRISTAVVRVCPPTPLPHELAKQHYSRVCREAARREADRQLKAVYGERLAQAELRARPAGH